MLQNKVYIGLGTNIGNWKNNFNQSFIEISNLGFISNFASIYLSKPSGYYNQRSFYNTAIELSTGLSPLILINSLKIIEKKLKKNKNILNGPRRIDLDIIFYNKIILENKSIVIPHPRAHLRDFVLCPIFEMRPFFYHPKEKTTIKQLINKLKEKFIYKNIMRQRESLIIF